MALILAAAVSPVAAQQGNTQTPQMPAQTDSPATDDARSQTPSPSPTVPDDSHGQSRSDNYRDDVNVAENPIRAETGMSWAIPLLTLLAGLAIGYFLGNRRPITQADVRRDRAA
jgi:hypothetical protein